MIYDVPHRYLGKYFLSHSCKTSKPNLCRLIWAFLPVSTRTLGSCLAAIKQSSFIYFEIPQHWWDSNRIRHQTALENGNESVFVVLVLMLSVIKFPLKLRFKLSRFWEVICFMSENIVNILTARMKIRCCWGLKGRIPTHSHNKFVT